MSQRPLFDRIEALRPNLIRWRHHLDDLYVLTKGPGHRDAQLKRQQRIAYTSRF